MVRTLEVSEDTRDQLEQYRIEVGADSVDAAIRLLLRQAESAFGSMKGWGGWEPTDRLTARSDEHVN